MTDDCMVCGEPVAEEYNKYDEDAPVYTDDGVYHLGCEEDVMDEIYKTITGDIVRIYEDPSTPSGKNWEYLQEKGND